MLRRLLTTFIILGALAFTGQAQSSGPVFGVRLAMDVTFPSGGHNPYKTGAGFTLGGVCNIPLKNSFFFEPGLHFYYTGMTAKDLIQFDEDYFYEGAAKMYGLRIPLHFGYVFDANDLLTIAISTGPWLSINLYARQSLLPNMSAPVALPDKTVNLFKHGWKRVDMLWGIAVSFTFAKSYTVGLTTGIGDTPLAKYGNRDRKIKIHRNVAAISLGYNF